ncbi:allophanate hydrolase [Paenarthrobacter sp. NPDC090522]|uniref:allophanate hydrolase n=1 Tax=Paenarthrobacter sp. NPDC090522 TaxID=3364383 RepID=UPI0037F4F816
MSAIVMDPGALTLVVPPDKALDRASLALANALLGNPDSAPGLEVLVGGLRLRFVTGTAIVVTGAEGLVRLNGSELAMNKAVRVAPGAVLEFGRALFGIRYYLAVQGGIEPQPDALHTGRTLAFGRPHGHGFPAVNQPARRALDAERPVVARVSPGPDAQSYDAGTWLRLTTEPWTLSPESDRVGARLGGRPLSLEGSPAPGTQPLVAGSVLLPPSGLPVIALADHPATSESPVIAVVRDEDLDSLGQARPGQMVHLLG